MMFEKTSQKFDVSKLFSGPQCLAFYRYYNIYECCKNSQPEVSSLIEHSPPKVWSPNKLTKEQALLKKQKTLFTGNSILVTITACIIHIYYTVILLYVHIFWSHETE